MTPPAAIGDFVWLDTNGNGKQDAGEPGIAGVTVKLLDSTGTTLLFDHDDEWTWLHSFAVAPGTFVVQFLTPAGRHVHDSERARTRPTVTRTR